MKVLITGTSRGIGRATAQLFLREGHQVIGLDKNESSLTHNRYVHCLSDITDESSLPDVSGVEILVNNAGIQTASDAIVMDDINTNLIGAMRVTERYAFQESIRSVLFISSSSALTGNEFPSYAASKAGMNGYMRNAAIRLANSYHATCNALCFGGVLTELNVPVMESKTAWKKIMDVTPLKRWMPVEEAAEWCYFMTVTNTFCTGQAIDVSGGERNCADLFVWE